MPKLMTPPNFKYTFGIGVMALLMWASVVATSKGAPAALTAGQIFETMRENYASLFSYSDRGQIITTMGGTVITTDFTTRLARPNLYRIQWNQKSQSPFTTDDTGPLGAWSSGAGNYMQIGMGVRRLFDREDALVHLAASSGGAVANVPSIFFNSQRSGSPNQIIGLDRLADDKIGKIECYVITGQTESGQTETFWVGKDDLLIHQIRTEVSPAVMQSALDSATGDKVDMTAHSYGSSSIETYTNMVVDKRFTHQDFVPSFPLFQR
jgi:hypothetical protein